MKNSVWILAILILIISSCDRPFSKNEIKRSIQILAYDTLSMNSEQVVSELDELVSSDSCDAECYIDAAWGYNRFERYDRQVDVARKIDSDDRYLNESKYKLLFEGYRRLQKPDSAFFYADKVSEIDGDTCRGVFSKLQVAFESELWADAIVFCRSGLFAKEKRTSVDSMLFHEYTVHVYLRTNQNLEACEYSCRLVPEFYDIIRDSICNPIFVCD